MSELLQDSTFKAILSVLAIISPASFFIYWKQRKRKSLGYELLSIMPLSSVDSNTLLSYRQIGLQITFNNEIISHAHFITVRITNTGNVPIKKEDFDEPITLYFGEKAKVLAWRGGGQNPEIQIKLKIEPQRVIVEPILLNDKDSFLIETFVSDFIGKVRVLGRIVGVKEIKDTSGGLPISREEELVNEALFLSIVIFLLAFLMMDYLIAIIAIGIAVLQVWRRINLK